MKKKSHVDTGFTVTCDQVKTNISRLGCSKNQIKNKKIYIFFIYIYTHIIIFFIKINLKLIGFMEQDIIYSLTCNMLIYKTEEIIKLYTLIYLYKLVCKHLVHVEFWLIVIDLFIPCLMLWLFVSTTGFLCL